MGSRDLVTVGLGDHIRGAGSEGTSALPWSSLDVEAQLTRPAHTLPGKTEFRILPQAGDRHLAKHLDYRVDVEMIFGIPLSVGSMLSS